jgi:hypothetical protein
MNLAIPHMIMHIGVWCVTNYAKVISNDQLHHMDAIILPSSFERLVILANDLVACAQYFDRIMNIVIDVLMGWDKKLQCLTQGGGLFGFCKGFSTSIEPKDLGTYMPIGWYIPMACQPLPLGL